MDSKKRRYRTVAFRNSNGLVRSGQWEIGLSKTGYISEAGRCLVMQARIAAKPVIIVLLDSWGKFTRIGDANRIKQWIERLEDGMLLGVVGLPHGDLLDALGRAAPARAAPGRQCERDENHERAYRPRSG